MYAQDKRADDNDVDSRIHELQAKIEYGPIVHLWKALKAHLR